MKKPRRIEPVSVRRVVAYLRCSTEEQARSGLGLESQLAKIKQYAALYDLQLVAVCQDDGLSGATLDRPALKDALAKLQRNEAEAIIVAKLDRLTRSLEDLLVLVRQYFKGEWSLLSVADQLDTRTANGRMVLHILGVIAEWERDTIGERTASAMEAKAARGEWLGGVLPYGHRVSGKKLIEDPREQAIIAYAKKRREAGATLQKIADALNVHKVPTRRRKQWTPTHVRRLLENED